MDDTKEIREVLDLGYSDFYVDDNVRDETLSRHCSELATTIACLSAEEAINYSLLMKLGRDHPSPQLYALDFPSDFRAALYVLLGGYYKQAMLCLRTWLEMRLTGIYFGVVDTDRGKYESWKNGHEEAPHGSGLITRLFSRAEFQKADQRTGVRQRVRSLYGGLSAFIHGGGVSKYGLQDDTDNVPRYNERSVRLHLETAGQTFAEIVYLLGIAYGEAAFALVDDACIETVLSVVPEGYRGDLTAVVATSRARL